MEGRQPMRILCGREQQHERNEQDCYTIRTTQNKEDTRIRDIGAILPLTSQHNAVSSGYDLSMLPAVVQTSGQKEPWRTVSLFVQLSQQQTESDTVRQRLPMHSVLC